MQKRGILLLTALISINIISAVGIGDALDMIGGENILLGGTFLISFALLNMILGRLKLFQNDYGQTTNTPIIISLILSIFIIYGIRTLNFDLEDLLFSLGLSGDIIYQIASIIIVIGLIYFLYKFGKKLLKNLCLIFIILGIVLIWIGLSDLVFNGEPLVLTGIVLVILGIICWWRRRKKSSSTIPYTPTTPTPSAAPTMSAPSPVINVNVPQTPGVSEADRQRQRNFEEEMRRRLENMNREIQEQKRSGINVDPNAQRAVDNAQRELKIVVETQQANEEAIAAAKKAQQEAEAARAKVEREFREAQEKIKVAQEGKRSLQEEYNRLQATQDPEEKKRLERKISEMETREKNAIREADAAKQDAEKAKKKIETVKKALGRSEERVLQAGKARKKAQDALNRSVKIAEEEAWKMKEKKEKAAAKAKRPSEISFYIAVKGRDLKEGERISVKPGEKIQLAAKWKGYKNPVHLQWSIDNKAYYGNARTRGKEDVWSGRMDLTKKIEKTKKPGETIRIDCFGYDNDKNEMMTHIYLFVE